MNISKDNWIIHLFAVLHALVSFICYSTGMADGLMLTLLTMFLVVLLCLRRRMSVLFMGIAVILVNIVGFGIGVGLAALLGLLPLPALAVHPLSTFVCTEILGWTTEWVCLKYLDRHPEGGASPDSRSLRWLLLAFIVIIIVRLLLIYSISGAQESRGFFVEILIDYILSCVIIVWVAEYAIRSREQAEKEAEKANLALFRYMKLKQQVNPHFLFNSLNVLDCMIQEQSAQAASRYTHKLAEIYRYMLRHEDETTVRLRDEMEFVDDYLELLKVRFAEGLQVNVNIPEEDLSRSVVPCSVQLLIENATKHNAVSASDPLTIDIHTTSNSVVVTNNLRPKLTAVSSTGLGLKYLRRQYKDIAGKSVIVKAGGDSYTVILPLL